MFQFKKNQFKEKLVSVRDFYRKNLFKTNLVIVVLFVLLLLSFFYSLFFLPARGFSEHQIFVVKEGDTLSKVSRDLEEMGIVKSSFWLRNLVIVFRGEGRIIAGDYYFNDRQNMVKVANRLVEGDYGLEPVRVTIPEGLNIFEISEILKERLVNFDGDLFLEKAVEGYLFPDTYLFSPNAGSKEIVSVMKNNFEVRTKELRKEVEDLGKDFDEIINLASILETEARTTEARRKIAGILKSRLEIGMPLQVDVTFKYINGKNTYQLTREDLQIDSPYNTYVYAGLPPTPIANPGLDSILAAIDPIESDYLYFLSDRSGNMYYAESFEDHIANRRFMDN